MQSWDELKTTTLVKKVVLENCFGFTAVGHKLSAVALFVSGNGFVLKPNMHTKEKLLIFYFFFVIPVKKIKKINKSKIIITNAIVKVGLRITDSSESIFPKIYYGFRIHCPAGQNNKLLIICPFLLIFVCVPKTEDKISLWFCYPSRGRIEKITLLLYFTGQQCHNPSFALFVSVNPPS